MFTVDLLKGQGLPIKSRPEGIAVAVIAFAVPVIIAIAMFGYYLHTRIIISIQKRGIINYETKISELSGAVRLQKSFEKEKNVINSSMSEVDSSIGRHTQWSDVLVTLVKNMPDSMVLTNLEVKQRTIKKKVPKKNNPEKKVSISVPVRTLQMSVSGSSQYNCDKAIRDFCERLRASDLLGPKLENIRVSQEVGTLEGQDVVAYEMDCIFKPGL